MSARSCPEIFKKCFEEQYFELTLKHPHVISQVIIFPLDGLVANDCTGFIWLGICIVSIIRLGIWSFIVRSR